MTAGTALVWLRRDLRLHDNFAIDNAVSDGHQIAVVFVIDEAILSSPRVSPARVALMCAALSHLDSALREVGSHLLVRRGRPAQVIPSLAHELSAVAVYANHDYTPYARRRDAAVATALERLPLRLSHDRLLVPPDTIATKAGTPYTVFTPYSKRWRVLAESAQGLSGVDLHGAFCDLAGVDTLSPPTAASLGLTSSIPLPEASPQAARQRLHEFAAQRINAYQHERDRLADFADPHGGTSSLSPYIRWGLIYPREIYRTAHDAASRAPDDRARESVALWLNQTIWYEFYASILWHFPHVSTQNFKPHFDLLAWRGDEADFVAWVEGRTGYPVVDAAMRQLAATGWMHNRARMITASFLTKDLLIDWRRGELYFMQTLLDGDLAANNGGWQWSASTGTDAQPYFRIFNPVAQSQRFDPDGTFIRRWVPELAALPRKFIHEPWRAPSPPADYPAPIVDHALARQRALAAFKPS